MAAGKQKSLDEIEDHEEMILLMKELGISAKGLKSLEQMKDHVRTTLGQSSKSSGWSAGQLTHDGQVKMTDVGIGKYEGQLTGTVFGTSLYLAPEVCKGRMYDSRADMYSFGFVLWELWYGEVSFRNMVFSREPSKLLEDIKCGLRPSHIDKTSEPFPNWREVIESCWEKDPKERMKAGDALKCLNQAKLHSTLDDVVD